MDCSKSPSTSMQLYLEPFVIPSLFNYYFYERLILFLNCTLHGAYLKALIMRGMLVAFPHQRHFPPSGGAPHLNSFLFYPWWSCIYLLCSYLLLLFLLLKHAFYRAWSLQALWCPVLLFLWPWSSLAVIWSLSLPSPVMLIMQPVMWPWDHHFLKKKLLDSH